MSTDHERHAEAESVVPAPVEAVFQYLDEPARLSSHMSERTWMMGGGRMEITTDAGQGRQVGSRVRLAGRVFGLHLQVEGVVTERDAPRHKAWETVGEPRLLIIGPYRMRLDLTPASDVTTPTSTTRVRVGIDYELPRGSVGRLLGPVMGPWYARWCTRRMATDAAKRFAPQSTPQSEARQVPSAAPEDSAAATAIPTWKTASDVADTPPDGR